MLDLNAAGRALWIEDGDFKFGDVTWDQEPASVQEPYLLRARAAVEAAADNQVLYVLLDPGVESPFNSNCPLDGIRHVQCLVQVWPIEEDSDG